MDRRRPPLPLNALPAFDAAARHESFRAAADELHLTPSAISHQIRTLEEALGVQLFRRLPRGLVLSGAGRSFARTVRDVLGRLDDDTERLIRTAAETERLRLSMPDFVARFHALPRLGRLRARHPHIELEIDMDMRPSSVEGGEADAAIRLGLGSWSDLRSYLMTPLVGTVVASPELASRARKLDETDGLPVLCMKNLEWVTRDSLARAGFSSNVSRVSEVDSCLALVQAAAEGQGVAVLYHPPQQYLSTEPSLVPLAASPAPFSMYFVCRDADADRPAIAAVRDWALEPD